MSYLNCLPTIYDYVTAPHGAMGWSEVCNCGTAITVYRPVHESLVFIA